ncbi:hypothetical protein [Roseimaritima ulvae]|uniref:hypothetical protein n=1 Tax=Roseimaritima ulvae TaxID=980254 RepID=UPI0011CDCB53|nr:hypothetical protein [Roseimaritima ulvae]
MLRLLSSYPKHTASSVSIARAIRTFRRKRNRSDVARKWIRILVTAIRKHDKRHLITVGLVPWSLDRSGLTSGFVPEKIAEDLDFIALHIPDSVFAAGNPCRVIRQITEDEHG